MRHKQNFQSYVVRKWGNWDSEPRIKLSPLAHCRSENPGGRNLDKLLARPLKLSMTTPQEVGWVSQVPKSSTRTGGQQR